MAVRRRYSTRVLLSAAAIGAAGGLVMIGLNLALVAMPPSTLAYSVYAATIPLWGLASFVAVAVFRLPGIAFLTTVFSGIVNLAAPFGFAQFTNVLIAAVIIELPFLVTGYRLWSDRFLKVAFPIASLLLSAVYLAASIIPGAIDPAEFFPWLAIGTAVAAVAVAAALTWASLSIAGRLTRAGFGTRRTDVVVDLAEPEPTGADDPS